ncbi:MAG TPA: hypothetical protein VD866_01920 [Urbifossiella sp.]|nr:hypothetical protein [Urbifossiella sp.]
MGPTELLVVNVVQDIVRVSLVGFALVCIVLAYLSLRLKGSNGNSTDLTMERGGVKIQVLRIGPFIAFVAMAAFGLHEACSVNFTRQVATQPYDINTSYRVAVPEPARIPPPGVPVRPDEPPVAGQRGR